MEFLQHMSMKRLTIMSCTAVILLPVQRKTFEGGNIHEFCSFRATRESFLHEIGHAVPTYDIGFSILRKFSQRVFSLENFLLFGIVTAYIHNTEIL